MIIIKIGFIGGGKVSFSLGKYLKNKNVNVVGYYSKSRQTIKDGAKFTSTREFYELSELVENCDCIFITTTDSEIYGVWEALKKLSIKNKIICHCSGALSSSIFNERENYNVFGYSVHPLIPIKDKYTSYHSLEEAFFVIEGDLEYLEKIKEFFTALGNKIKIIKKEDKEKYHLSAVMGSNLVISLISLSIDKLKECGFSEEEAIEALYPLIKSNIENIKDVGILNALTGPIERNDKLTVSKHLNVLKGLNEKMVYKLLSLEGLKIAKNKNKNKDYSDLERIL